MRSLQRSMGCGGSSPYVATVQNEIADQLHDTRHAITTISGRRVPHASHSEELCATAFPCTLVPRCE